MTTAGVPPRYVLVTPARDEERNIERTIASVLAQTVRPARWVIVSDGSTDATDAIVARYAEQHSFLTLLRRDGARGEGFGSKVAAFAAGYRAVRGCDHDFVGNLDADVTFPPDYFERVLAAFAAEPALGVAGGLVHERVGGLFRPQRNATTSVAGAVQLFRRECWEAVGGFVPLPLGGEDASAEIAARAAGWGVRTLVELEVRHHGRVLSGGRSVLRSRFRRGITNYLLGYHPAFHVAGYAWAAVTRRASPMPAHLVTFVRREQRARLRAVVRRAGPAAGAFVSSLR